MDRQMQSEPIIRFRNVDRSEAVETQIRRRTDELEKRFDRIVGCEILVEAAQKRKISGQEFKVHLKVRIPGPDIDVSQSSDLAGSLENINLAVHRAFDTAARQLVERKRRMSGH
jgi:ribosome-associated translation inhibitor RaiA